MSQVADVNEINSTKSESTLLQQDEQQEQDELKQQVALPVQIENVSAATESASKISCSREPESVSIPSGDDASPASVPVGIDVSSVALVDDGDIPPVLAAVGNGDAIASIQILENDDASSGTTMEINNLSPPLTLCPESTIQVTKGKCAPKVPPKKTNKSQSAPKPEIHGDTLPVTASGAVESATTEAAAAGESKNADASLTATSPQPSTSAATTSKPLSGMRLFFANLQSFFRLNRKRQQTITKAP